MWFSNFLRHASALDLITSYCFQRAITNQTITQDVDSGISFPAFQPILLTLPNQWVLHPFWFISERMDPKWSGDDAKYIFYCKHWSSHSFQPTLRDCCRSLLIVHKYGNFPKSCGQMNSWSWVSHVTIRRSKTWKFLNMLISILSKDLDCLINIKLF